MASKSVTQYNKKDLIEKVAEVSGVSKAEAERQVQNVFDGIEAIVKKMEPEDKLQLVGYLTLEVVARKAHEGSNPKTGEKINIPAKNALKLKAGKVLVDGVVQPKEPKAKKSK